LISTKTGENGEGTRKHEENWSREGKRGGKGRRPLQQQQTLLILRRRGWPIRGEWRRPCRRGAPIRDATGEETGIQGAHGSSRSNDSQNWEGICLNETGRTEEGRFLLRCPSPSCETEARAPDSDAQTPPVRHS
jgi:hypothetical protein